MSKQKIGDACAYIPRSGAKNIYLKIGVAFQDEQGRISFKIDSLPLSGTGWDGWVNVFEDKFQKSSPPDGDIPF